jgi:hypothetical protein
MVLLIILHTKSKSQFKLILPSSESRWRISISPRHIQKKEELSLLSLLSHKNTNAAPNKLIYRYHFQELSKTLSKFEGYAYLSVYHFWGVWMKGGAFWAKRGTLHSVPVLQLKTTTKYL